MLTDLDYELLSAYIDGALTESQHAAFELRLQAEPELNRELEELRATITLLNNLPPHKAPRNFTLDARYTRRTSFFFTSATFSALSTAAAVVLFALGAYLFTGAKTPLASSAEPVGQSAFAVSPTANILDKSAATTATEPLMNELQLTTTLDNDPSVADGIISPSELPLGNLVTGEPPQLPDQLPLFHPDTAQLTALPSDDTFSSSMAAASPLPDAQARTDEATAEESLQQYAAPSSSSNTGGAAAPVSPIQETESDASAAAVFAATQPPLTATPLSTATVVPTRTLTPTPTRTSLPTAAPTLLPTALPPPAPSLTDALDFRPLLLIGLGIVLLIIAIMTTIIRRRNR